MYPVSVMSGLGSGFGELVLCECTSLSEPVSWDHRPTRFIIN